MPEPSGTTTARHEFTITRVFHAPRELVFRAWTDPAHLTRWFGPHGHTTPLATITTDVAPGGSWRLCMVCDADGSEYPSEMVYREVVEPERLVFAWGSPENPVGQQGAAVVTVTFTDLGDKTAMSFHQTGVSTDDGGATVQAGWTESFDRLTEYVAHV